MFFFPEAAKQLHCALELPHSPTQFSGASLDTRTIKQGELFVALSGTKDDGHRFLEAAFQKGAAGAIVSSEFFQTNRDKILKQPDVYRNLLPVKSQEQSLQTLASWARAQFKRPVIGITGSVGKTTTKEFLAYILSRQNNILSTQGNFNNQLGLPLTLLRLKHDHRFLVLELGASHVGDIKQLTDIASPDFAIITQVAASHLSGFGSLEGVYQGKLELAAALPKGQPVILPDDDSVLIQRAQAFGCKVVCVGEKASSLFVVSEVEVKSGYVHFKVNGRAYSFPGIAGFLARNAAMAIGMAHLLGIKETDIPTDWSDLKIPGGRFQEEIVGEGIRVIFDGYNANPASFSKALEAFRALPVDGKKYLVFSDMLELGAEEKKCHEDIGRLIADCHFEKVFAYGACARLSVDVIRQEFSQHAEHFSSADELADKLIKILRPHDAVLLKASRGMKIERVQELIRQSHPATLIGNAFTH